MTRILLLGHGRMGQLVESLAPSYGATIAGVIDERSGERAIADGDFGDVDVAVDFTLAEAVVKNLPQLAARKINVVIGTTGWQSHEAAMRELVERTRIGVLAASNFSLGMNVFQMAVEEASRRFANHAEFGAWIHEAHHTMKKDAPSGTALTLGRAAAEGRGQKLHDVAALSRQGMSPRQAGEIGFSVIRGGDIVGDHSVMFAGTAERIILVHQATDRSIFARGALQGAAWLAEQPPGRYTMRDVIAFKT